MSGLRQSNELGNGNFLHEGETMAPDWQRSQKTSEVGAGGAPLVNGWTGSHSQKLLKGAANNAAAPSGAMVYHPAFTAGHALAQHWSRLNWTQQRSTLQYRLPRGGQRQRK